jgi:hypothetical protein
MSAARVIPEKKASYHASSSFTVDYYRISTYPSEFMLPRLLQSTLNGWDQSSMSFNHLVEINEALCHGQPGGLAGLLADLWVIWVLQLLQQNNLVVSLLHLAQILLAPVHHRLYGVEHALLVHLQGLQPAQLGPHALVKLCSTR